jgi:uncharacterized membrane protein YbhN (UPF0104 family)
MLGRARDWLIGGVILGGLIVAVAQAVGWSQLLAPWRELAPGLLLAALALSLLSYLLRAVRVYDLFRYRLGGRFRAVLRLSILHNVANNLLPMRAGEMVFPWLMQRHFGFGFGGSLAALVWIRLLDLHFLALTGFFVLHLREPSGLWLLGALLWLGLMPLIPRAARRFPRAGRGVIGRLSRGMADAAPPSAPLVSRLYLWTALSWVCKLTAFAVVLRHFLPLELWRLLVGVLGAELSSVLPFHGIAGSGSYELAAVAALLPFGVSAEAALAGAVNLHLFLLGVTLLLGLGALALPVGSTTRQAGKESRAESD